VRRCWCFKLLPRARAQPVALTIRCTNLRERRLFVAKSRERGSVLEHGDHAIPPAVIRSTLATPPRALPLFLFLAFFP